MSEEKKEGSGLAAAMPVTAMLAILAGMFLSSSLPYKDERPSVRPLQSNYSAVQDVEARLWQDPFAAIDGVAKCQISESHNPPSNVCDKKQLYYDSANDKDITILAVTLSGGSYQEAAEQRMRRRYAVLSALINQNFVPRDEQHIGYFQPYSKEILQKNVPFEWWSLPKSATNNARKLLLLWVDESSLLEQPATKLRKLLIEARPEIHPPSVWNPINYAVIGPNTSTILRDMLQEVECSSPIAVVNTDRCTGRTAKDTLGKINGQNIVYFSAGATASDNKLLEEFQTVKDETVSSYFKGKSVTLYRTTATDNDMMIRLTKELKLRHIDDKDHIVILSEGDTFYGRSMPDAFNEKWDDLWNKQDKNKTVHIYSYMRGLDGKLPDKGDKTGNTVEKKSDSKDKSSADNLIEVPEGQNQKDYLRRLAANIFALDQSLKNGEDKNGNQKGIAAFGILGSDVHDKLMILEALRQYFPHKLFFTTDLDVIYSHSSKLPQTHNLLVISPFDLMLRHELQDKIPPFRDSYQTAFFLATQTMLKYEQSIQYKQSIPDDWIDNHNLSPRLFEIGRSHIVPLPIDDDKIFSTHEDSTCSWTDWQPCDNNVQPPIIATYAFTSWYNSMLAILSVVVILPLVSWRVRKSIGSLWVYIVCIVGIIGLGVVIKKIWAFYIIQHDTEPFYWFEGVSIWPSQLLRLLIVLFVIVFFLWGNKRIGKMQEDLQARTSTNNHDVVFALPSSCSSIPVTDWWKLFFVSNWKGLFSTGFPDQLWKEYNSHCQRSVSTVRAVAHAVVFFVVAWLIIKINPPNVPMRGDTALTVNVLMIFMSVPLVILLTMWVVENALLCRQLITHLSAKPSQWNRTARVFAMRKNKIAPECVDDWLDIQLVVRLTETLQPLIWGPMVCLVLLVMARSPVIDDWDVPWQLRIVLITMLLYAVFAEICLQQGAERARNKAIAQLTSKIKVQRNRKHPNDIVINRIEAEIEGIKLLREGAFKPWYEWSLLRSFGGLGTLVILLQYLEGLWENGAL